MIVESKRQIFAPTHTLLTDSSRFVVLPSSSQESSASSSQSSQSSLSSEGSVTIVPSVKMSDAIRSKERSILRLGKNRLDTFTRYKYPNTGVPFEKLADAAFFCRSERPPQQPDQVECIFCQVKISNWSSGMDPVEQHIKFSPRCEFVMGYHVNNIPVDGKLGSDPIRGCSRSRHREPDICGSGPASLAGSQTSSGSSSPDPPVSSTTRSAYSQSFGQNHVPHQTPGFPRYVTTEARLSTFPANWDTICPIPAERLAEAGLFFDGSVADRDLTVNDAVTCFHCKRVIGNWVASDDPWLEHKRLCEVAGIDCYFLRLNYDRSPQTAANVATAEASSGIVQPAAVAAATTASTSSQATPAVSEEPKKVFKDMGRALGSLASSFEKRSSDADGRCKVCYVNEIEILFLPCRHATCCASCTASVDRCPYCRAAIDGSVRIYLS